MKATWNENKLGELEQTLETLRKRLGEVLSEADIAYDAAITEYKNLPWWKKLYTDDPTALRLWTKCARWPAVDVYDEVNYNMRRFNVIYDRVNRVIADGCSSLTLESDEIDFLRNMMYNLTIRCMMNK